MRKKEQSSTTDSAWFQCIHQICSPTSTIFTTHLYSTHLHIFTTSTGVQQGKPLSPLALSNVYFIYFNWTLHSSTTFSILFIWMKVPGNQTLKIVSKTCYFFDLIPLADHTTCKIELQNKLRITLLFAIRFVVLCWDMEGRAYRWLAHRA